MSGVRSGSFKRGMRNRHPLVLVAAVAALILALAGLEAYFVSGDWTEIPLKYLLRKSSDDYTYVSWAVGSVKRDPPHVPALYLLGGSTAREALVSGPSLAQQIVQDGGPRTVALDLGSMNQNFAQSMVVADNVPAKNAWLLVGINLGRFTPDRGSSFIQSEGRELLLWSGFLQQYVSTKYGKYKYDFTILPGIFAYLSSYVQQHDTELLDGQLPTRVYGHHRYTTALSVKRKEQMVKIWNTRRYPLFQNNLQFNLAMLQQLIIRARQRGLHVVLVELPSNHALIGDRFDYAIRQYQGPVEALAREYDVPYLDFSQSIGLTNNDFHDLSHLIGPGRVVWQGALAKALTPILNSAEKGSSQ